MNLTIRDMSKRYANGVQALDHVSLDIAPGMFGLLGPNGAGKSTLMRTLATLQEADSGTATLGDIDVLRDKDRVRRILGYLPQDFGLYPKVTANDMLDHFARLKGVTDAAQRKATVEALLERTNLADVRHRALGSFSGGMRQRFGIAQALIGNPQLIIVDEPTAGLDPEERVRFHNLLAGISRESVVILSTHIVDDVADLCPSFAVISKGRVVLSGSPAANVQAIRGKVWQRSVPRESIEHMQKSLPLISSRPSGGEVVVHAFGASAPGEGFAPAEPSLEDVYFSAVAGHLGQPLAAAA